MKQNVLSKIILAVSLVFLTTLAQAETPLENIMKAMAKENKAIAMQVNDPAQNSVTLANVRNLQALVTQSINEIPKSVVGVADQDVQVEAYKQSMDAFLKLTRELEEALVANDNSKAAAIFAKMGEMKKAGHERFKKD